MYIMLKDAPILLETNFVTIYFIMNKDKRIIILYVVPISPWPTLGKENYRHSNNNDR